MAIAAHDCVCDVCSLLWPASHKGAARVFSFAHTFCPGFEGGAWEESA